jgi:cytochrome P450
LLQNPDLFSSIYTSIPQRPGAAKLISEELDSPKHTKYRSLLNRKRGPKMIKHFDARTRSVVRDLVAAVEADRKADLMAALTIALPCTLFLDLVGLPSSRTFEFVSIKNQLFKGETLDRKIEAQGRINEVIAGVIASVESPA